MFIPFQKLASLKNVANDKPVFHVSIDKWVWLYVP